MRFKSVLFLGLVSVAAPAMAQNYSAQPAPQSWNVPAPRPNPQPQDDMIVVDMTAPRNTQANPNLNAAVSCAAVLQIATLAAPTWSNEHGVANATNLWLERVFSLAEQNGVNGDQVNNLVKAEMERQTNSSVSNPAALNRKAFDCATNPPR
jgi:hypothetical protein